MWNKIFVSLIFFIYSLKSFADTTVATPPSNTGLPNANNNVSLSDVQTRANTGLTNAYVLLSGAGVCLGLFICIMSLRSVAAISQGKKDGSIAAAWFGLIIGGLLSSASYWMFSISKTADTLITGGDS